MRQTQRCKRFSSNSAMTSESQSPLLHSAASFVFIRCHFWSSSFVALTHLFPLLLSKGNSVRSFTRRGREDTLGSGTDFSSLIRWRGGRGIQDGLCLRTNTPQPSVVTHTCRAITWQSSGGRIVSLQPHLGQPKQWDLKRERRWEGRGSREMAQRVKALRVKPDSLSSNLRTHMKGGEN